MLLKAWHHLTAIVLSPVPKVIFLIKATVDHLSTMRPVIKLGFSELQFLLVSCVHALELGPESYPEQSVQSGSRRTTSSAANKANIH